MFAAERVGFISSVPKTKSTDNFHTSKTPSFKYEDAFLIYFILVIMATDCEFRGNQARVLGSLGNECCCLILRIDP